MDAYKYHTIATGGRGISLAKYGVTNAAVEILPINPDRRVARISNEGNTTIWLGATSNMTAGQQGRNFLSLSSGSNSGQIEHYTGPVYALAEGVSAGASVGPVWLGVADIGD